MDSMSCWGPAADICPFCRGPTKTQRFRRYACDVPRRELDLLGLLWICELTSPCLCFCLRSQPFNLRMRCRICREYSSAANILIEWPM